MSKIRIISRAPDGSRGNEPPQAGPHSNSPTRGSNIRITIVNDDGTETPMPNVRSVSIGKFRRQDPVVLTLEIYVHDLDIIAEGEFIGKDRGCPREHVDDVATDEGDASK